MQHLIHTEDTTMSYRTTRQLSPEDRTIYLTVLSFLSSPMLLLLGAGTAIVL